ncbi:hypothetical protein AQ490_19255 [Wenjunlia vitaminophila]|uniref:Glyoxalase-like domain-containing protein n=1 Tax=Wenjunlia vitaminophila TaxID=76728 RepID=A0A0T6LV45_WENVI|nr:VOC family protein [Wenjunlia vitaminophila]KRV49880.1 hypothetical protein AQ490_19255 [Wenjunlia vitaminophila]
MAIAYKLVIDCTEPIALADFWARALGYQVEDHSSLIDRLLATGVVGAGDHTTVDGHKAWRHAAGIRHPDDPVDRDTGVGLGRRLLFNAVPEPKQGKNRLHLDLHVGAGRRDAEVRRLTELGATVLRVVEEPGTSHVTMADPEGNEFDVQ